MDKLRAMQVFCKVVECGSFTRAADILELSTATISESVKNLEAHVGTLLIQRSSRHLKLTAEGETYYQRCIAILSDVARAETEIKDDSTKASGTVRVEATIAIGETVIAPLIPKFIELFPSLNVALSLINSPRNIIQYGTDIAIRGDKVDNGDLWARAIFDANYVACASPTFAKAHAEALSPYDLDPSLNLGLLMEGQYAPQPWRFSNGEEHCVVSPDGPISSSSTSILIRAAEEGLGAIHVLDVLVARSLSSGRLVRLFPQWQTETRPFYAVTQRTRFIAPRIKVFMKFLEDSLDGGDNALTVPVGAR